MTPWRYPTLITATFTLSSYLKLIKNDKSSVLYEIKMTEIERILNDAMALPNINNGNPLCHNDDFCRHPIVILLEVVNDAAPWYIVS